MSYKQIKHRIPGPYVLVPVQVTQIGLFKSKHAHTALAEPCENTVHRKKQLMQECCLR